jgi:DNA-binding transcriptional regulator YiaG
MTKRPIPDIVAIRQYLHLSVDEMAKRIGVKPVTVEGWESGAAHPSRGHVKLIAQVLLDGIRQRRAEGGW